MPHIPIKSKRAITLTESAVFWNDNVFTTKFPVAQSLDKDLRTIKAAISFEKVLAVVITWGFRYTWIARQATARLIRLQKGKERSMRVVKTPALLRNSLPNNELAGLMDGIDYSDIGTAVDNKPEVVTVKPLRKRVPRKSKQHSVIESVVIGERADK